MTVLNVSDGELRRLEVLRDVDRGSLPVRAAAQLLETGISGGLCLPAAFLPIGLGHPMDRLGRGFEFASQAGRITPGTHQLDYLAPKF